METHNCAYANLKATFLPKLPLRDGNKAPHAGPTSMHRSSETSSKGWKLVAYGLWTFLKAASETSSKGWKHDDEKGVDKIDTLLPKLPLRDGNSMTYRLLGVSKGSSETSSKGWKLG